MTVRRVSLAAAICVGLTLLTAWLFEWPLEKAVYLAPVIVVTVGALAGLVVLWSRVAWESIRHREHPRRIVALIVGAFLLILALSLLGLKLPKE